MVGITKEGCLGLGNSLEKVCCSVIDSRRLSRRLERGRNEVSRCELASLGSCVYPFIPNPPPPPPKIHPPSPSLLFADIPC